MGCFLACLGSSKNKKGKYLQSNCVPTGARDQRRGYNPVEQVVYADERLFKPVQQATLADEDVQPESELKPAAVSVSKLQNKAVEEFSAGSNESVQLEVSPKKSSLASSPSSLGSRDTEKSVEKSSSEANKKLSFSSVVKTYEPVPTCELTERDEFSGEEKVVAKPNKSASSSEAGSIPSSLGTYPPNHRYQNCRESDDEEELDYKDCDIITDSEDEYSDGDGDVITDSVCSMESESVNRAAYDKSVLNPVENLLEWKALKAIEKKPPLQKPLKENSASNFKEPPVASFSHGPIINQARAVKSITGHPDHQTHQMAVDASLSNWLVSPEPLNKPKASTVEFHKVRPQETAPQGSHSPRSFDDRPILGAMTVEELKLLSSRKSSPRKSPSKSPDDVAIIGSVGSYWSNEKTDKHSSQDSSRKGMPNKTSKYREDMRVNWDSTPFETRLENALNQGSAQA